MAQTTDANLIIEADVIKNETVAGANTAARNGAMLNNIIDSKINNDKIDTDPDLDTPDKNIPEKDAVKAYIEAQVSIMTNVSIGAAADLNDTGTYPDPWSKIYLLSGSSYTVNLPTMIGNGGKSIAFKALPGLTGTVTLDGLDGQTLDSELTRLLGAGGIIVIESDDTNGIVVSEVGSFVAWTPTVTGFTVGSEPTINAKDCRVGNWVFELGIAANE